jgi:hypothetical protein
MTNNPLQTPVRTGDSAGLFRLVRDPVRFRIFLLLRLPAAFFSGVRVQSADEDGCTVTIRYKWFTKNPFRSTYFACLSMAAEMSTGVLGLAHLRGLQPPVSMLVVGIEGQFFKKATGRTRFTCTDGARIRETIGAAIATGESQTIRARSVGVNAEGDKVAEFFVTWSFKQKAVRKG